MADWLDKVNKPIENGLDVIQEVLFEARELRGIRNLVKTAEFTEMA